MCKKGEGAVSLVSCEKRDLLRTDKDTQADGEGFEPPQKTPRKTRFLPKAAQNPTHSARKTGRKTPSWGSSSTHGRRCPRRSRPASWQWYGRAVQRNELLKRSHNSQKVLPTRSANAARGSVAANGGVDLGDRSGGALKAQGYPACPRCPPAANGDEDGDSGS